MSVGIIVTNSAHSACGYLTKYNYVATFYITSRNKKVRMRKIRNGVPCLTVPP